MTASSQPGNRAGWMFCAEPFDSADAHRQRETETTIEQDRRSEHIFAIAR
ncbi:MAG: hypothetical protein ACT6RN_14050 [Agrobacterium sp.]